MKYNELTLKPHKKSRRKGRGISAGQGKTAGRGTKGQGSRAGSGAKPGFEGGQTPLMQRLPKLRGFRPIKAKPTTITTGQIETLKEASVDSFVLANAGLIDNPYIKVKLVLKGEISQKKTIKLPSASAGAIKAIQKAGGSFSATERAKRQPKKATEEAKT